MQKEVKQQAVVFSGHLWLLGQLNPKLRGALPHPLLQIIHRVAILRRVLVGLLGTRAEDPHLRGHRVGDAVDLILTAKAGMRQRMNGHEIVEIREPADRITAEADISCANLSSLGFQRGNGSKTAGLVVPWPC